MLTKTPEQSSKNLESLENLMKSKNQKLDELRITLKTRTESWNTAKELLGFNLEEANSLARISDVVEICNKNKNNFFNICNKNLWLDLKIA